MNGFGYFKFDWVAYSFDQLCVWLILGSTRIFGHNGMWKWVSTNLVLSCTTTKRVVGQLLMPCLCLCLYALCTRVLELFPDFTYFVHTCPYFEIID